MVRKIAVLNCGPVNKKLVGKYGEYDEIFAAFLSDPDLRFSGFDSHLGEFPPIHDFDGFVLSGSAYGAYEDHDFIPPLEEFIRAVYAAEKPMVGICFGHQIMAQALGGKVEKFDGGWGLGPTSYQTEIEGLNGSAIIHAVHQDQVVVKPEQAKVIASSDFCKYAGLAYANEKAISFQPHPEFSDDWMKDLIEARRGELFPNELADQVVNELGAPVTSNKVGDLMKDFLKQT